MQREQAEPSAIPLPASEATFAALVRPHLARLHALALAILASDDDARDALQEALTHAWQGLSGLRDSSKAEAWLTKILVNDCRTALRRRRRQPLREIRVEPVASADEAGDGDVVDLVSNRDLMERAFERLDAETRAVLALRYLCDRTIPQIAATLAIPEGTVKSRLHTARHSLARSLERELR
jgi:RNA polymerase sigma-70 factor (ECF subfamily)